MKRLIVTAVSGVVAAAIATPATAQPWQVDDPARDHAKPADNFRGHGDISQVRVAHRPKKLFVNVSFRFGSYDEERVFINVNAERLGPEYAILRTYWGVTLWRSGPKFRTHTRVPCQRLGAANRRGTVKVLKLRVARNCIKLGNAKLPKKVQVSVEATDETYTTSDWAPGKRKFSPWLRAG